jgi:autotransporter-associated beta strand protein
MKTNLPKSPRLAAFFTCLLFLSGTAAIPAATITMNASDGAGQSSFNSGLHWTGGATPVAGNSYDTTSAYLLRTPSGLGTPTNFAGDALILTGPGTTAAGGGRLDWTGKTGGTITVNNLIVTNFGMLQNGGTGGNTLVLAGGLTIQADPAMNNTNGCVFLMGNGSILLNASVSGSGAICLGTPSAGNSSYSLILAGDLGGFTGPIVTTDHHVNCPLIVSNATDQVIAGNIGILDPLTKQGTGKLTLSGSNTCSGGITISGGTLVMASTNALGTGALAFSGAANPTLDMATDGSDAINAINVGSGVTFTIASDVKTGSTGINHTLGALSIGSGSPPLQMNVVAGPNVAGGSPAITAGPITLSGGFGGTSIFNPTTAALVISDVTASSTSKILQLDGTNSVNTVTGSISDGGANVITLVKTNSSTWTFTGANYYSGSTIIGQGTLALSGGGGLPASTNISLGAAGTLDVTSVSGGIFYVSYGQTLSGNGTVLGAVNTGSGTLLPGADGVAGTLTVGDLSLSSGAAHGFDLANNTAVGGGTNDLMVVSGNLDISSPGTPITFKFLNGNPAVGAYTLFEYGTFSGDVANLALPVNLRYAFGLTNDTSAHAIKLIVSGTPASLVWQGDGFNNLWDNAGSYQSWSNTVSQSLDYFYDGDNVTFNDAGSDSPAINLTSVNSPGSLTVAAAQNYDFTGSGGIGGGGGLTKNGGGTLILETANTYSGPTVINGGALQIGNGGAAGTLGTGPVTNNATLQFGRADAITLPNALHGPGTIVVNSGALTPSSAANDFSGSLVVNGGIFYAANTNALGTVASGTTVNSGGQVYITANVNFGGEALSLNGPGDGNGALRKGGAGATVYAGAVTLGSDTTVGVDTGASLTLSNLVSGPAALTKIGGGTLALTSSNTYAGDTTVAGGILELGDDHALGAGTSVNVSSTTGGALGGTRVTLDAGVNIPAAVSLSLPCAGTTVRSILYAAGASSWNGPITLNGDGTPSPGDQLAFSGADGFLTISGNITGNNFPGTLQLRGNGNSGAGGLIAGNIALADNATVQVNDATTWTIASTGNTWGISEIASGTLKVGTDNALPVATIVNMGAAGNGTLDLNGFSQQVAALNAIAHVNLITNSSVASDATLTFATNSGSSSYAGFIKDGARKLNLNVAAGTLTLPNAASLSLASSTVAVAAGAGLDLEFTGTNTVAGFVTNGVAAGPGLYSAANSAPYLAGTGYLLVQPSGPSGPAYLTNSVAGGVLTLAWPAGQNWRLEMQTNSLAKGLGPNWVDVTPGPASSTNITINPAQPAAFYRLVYP